MKSTATLRQLFDQNPYPLNPIEMSPQDDINFLYLHSLTTAHYLRGDGYVKSEGKVILDVGCGSGYGALIMAIANPSAKVVGIDLSSKSIEVAKERLQFHGFKDCEFHAMSVEELPNLGRQFDYINCDETLYLLPDPVQGLQIMASVLAPQGIIRTNLHSIYGRAQMYQGQALSKFLGLMEGEISDWECEVIRELMQALKEGVIMHQTWKQLNNENEQIRMNFLLYGDKGYIIPEMFEMLEASNLDWICMVNWQKWHLEELFQNGKSLPEYVDLLISEASDMQRLHLFELLQPVHRLLDFWCGHQSREIIYQPINLSEISYSDRQTWQTINFHLHPQLRSPKLKQALDQAIAQSLPFPFTQFLSCTAAQVVNLSLPASICLWLLWEQPRDFAAIVRHWLTIKPVNHLTLAPVSEPEAFSQIHQALIQLELLLAVLVDSKN